MSRIPLVAAVVGALLVGGAVTGGTYASWTQQRQLHAHGVQSGALSFTATSPGAVSVNQVSGSTADATFVLDDTSVGKNLQQRITASVAGTPAGITATVGTSCAPGAPAFVDTTPTSANQSLCVRVTSSTTAVSGNVTVNISGAQRPTGWSTPVLTRSFQVTVNSPFTLGCDTNTSNNAYRITWSSISGETYQVKQSATANGPYNVVANNVAQLTYISNSFGGQETRWFQVVSSTGVTSNILGVRRSGNSWICPVAP